MSNHSDDDSTSRGDVEASAMRFLARRDHARGELARKLRRRGFPDRLIDDVLDSLADSGYLNDRRFAVEQGAILARKCWGPRRISQKLRKRGVDDDIIDEALAEIEKDEDWNRRARERLMARFGAPCDLEESELGRAYRHLTRRGYRPNLVRALLFD